MAAGNEQVTVDKAYFDALLRRADFHTRTLGDPASVTISRAEYDSLLRESREYELLKNSLFSGGITPETLGLLISGAGDAAPQNNPKINSWADDYEDAEQYGPYGNKGSLRNEMPWKQGNGAYPPRQGNGAYLTGQSQLRVPSALPPQRHNSYGAASSVPDDTAFDEAESFVGSNVYGTNNGGCNQRTLYFSNLPARTTYRDLLSVIKGGKVLSVNLRSEKSATVTFLDAAADYLTWTKRNDIYLHSKRVDVRWADRQFKLNQHISNKIANGASRNLCIRAAASHGLTEQRIRDDMEHIHNLVIVDITYRNGSGDAYVATNSVHNALFARTCMMSRTTYKGCKIEFYPDECDVPMPQPAPKTFVPQPQMQSGKGFETLNRFGMLGLNDGGSSDEENRGPITARVDDDDDDETLDWSHHGVSVNG